MSDENLTKVRIDLPQHWAINGESFWAEALGKDLYRIRNVPFYAYGLNFYDVVRAVPDEPDTVPEICEVVEPSGHKTLRILFQDKVSRASQVEMLNMLEKFKAYYERANDIHIAVDVEVEGSFNDVYDQLQAWEDEGLLSFETCEARVEGSFDDLLEEE